MRVMKNSDDAMEKVLAGLRGVEAPNGMERRILSALAEKREEEFAVGWGWLRPMWMERPVITRAFICGAALAGLVAVGFLIPGFRGIWRAPVQSKPVESKMDSSLSARGSSSASASPVAETSPLTAARAGVRASPKTDKRDATVMARMSDGKGAIAANDDSVAVSEMRAESHPAPPMPLTEQERLLLRIVHKDDPVEVAVLNPAWRAARDAEDQAEFQSFFGVAAERSATFTPKVEQPAAEQPATEQPATEQPAMEQPKTEQFATQQ
jgi:hypothetical protein